MLARGVLCRLATDVPKTSTHDLPRLSQLLTSTLLNRNAASPPTVRALSRAYRAALFERTRSYATSTRSTQPTQKVKKDVKRVAAKKTTAKTTKRKTVAKKKAKPKRKVAAKPKPKPKRAKRVLTPEEKEKASLKASKEKALKPPVRPIPSNAWAVFAAESLKQSHSGGTRGVEELRGRLQEAAAKFKGLTPAEKEHYNHLANERTADKKAEFDAWVRSYTPEQIRVANIARTTLQRKAKNGAKIPKVFLFRLHDDRQVKKPASPWAQFVAERRSSGDHAGISPADSFRLCASEWKVLDASEKKKYEDKSATDLATYKREYENTYGHA